MTTSIRLHVVFPSLSVSTCSQDDAQRKRKSVRKTVDIPFLKSVDKQKSQQYQGVARSGKEMTDTISRGIVCKISSQNLIKINISLLEVLFWRANLYFLLQKYFLLYKALTIARHQLGTIKLLGDLNTWMCS